MPTCGRARRRWLRRALRLRVRRRVLLRSRSARVHGSRTHHGTFYAPSTVLKTEGLTGAPALSYEFSSELAVRVYGERRRTPLSGRQLEPRRPRLGRPACDTADGLLGDAGLGAERPSESRARSRASSRRSRAKTNSVSVSCRTCGASACMAG